MTAPTSSSRVATAPRSPSATRGRLRRLSAALAVALGILLPLAPFSPAVAATQAAETPTPSPTPTPTHAGVQVSLLPDAHGTYSAGSPLSASLTIRNDAATGLSAGTVGIALGRTPLADRTAVSAWLHGTGVAPALTEIGEARTGVLGAGDASKTSVVVPAGDVGALAPGVYPIRARFEAATNESTPHTSTATSSSVLVVGRGAAPSVLSIVPLTATPAGSLLSAAELSTLTAPEGALTAQLEGVTGTSAVLAIDPSIAAAIRVLGANAPATATAWLSRLEALPNERFLLQFGDADVAAQAAAGLTAPLTVDSYLPFTDPSGKGSSTPTPTPTATSAPSDVAAKDPAAVAGARTDILWPRGEVSTAEVGTMTGYRSTGEPIAATLLPSTSFTAGAKDAPVPAHGTVGDAPVLVTDTAVSAALSSAAVEDDATRRGADLAEANAQLWFADPGSIVIAGLARADVRSAAGLSDAVSTFAGSQDGRLIRALTAPASALTVTTASAADRGAAVTTLDEDAGRLAAFATILDRPEDLTIRERISILRLLGVGVHTTAEDFAAALLAHRDATRKTMDAVGIQPSNPILISAKVDVPVWVRNDLPYPVRVRLHVTSSDPRIEVPAQKEVEAGPSSTTRVKLPVEAHVSDAEVDLGLTLTSSTGVAIGAGQSAHLTIRAQWETIGLIVFGSLAVLLIAAGVFRTVRRRRSATHASNGMDNAGDRPSESGGAAESAEDGPAETASEDSSPQKAADPQRANEESL
ncbi:DUF6049 family protein [uncultured Microbacterium sp.]|uniref:DUF6049 family protein n=1 Tax=uncultured Microbacterium sp. TaxID=191216 RepID=UPI0025CC8FAD|nr:DUF6049 family protein [uncultured Microbacterium sp.]